MGIGAAACNAQNVGGIVHEFTHAIGLNHAHQNPEATNYLEKATKNRDQCDVEPRGWHWLKQYDPASIMHYSLGSCGFKLKKSTTNPKVDEIDSLVNSSEICGYNSEKGKGCFDKKTQFRNRECMSFVDQAWIYSAYKLIEKDTFKLQRFINNKQCTVIN